MGFGLTCSWLDGEGLCRKVCAALEAGAPAADTTGAATAPVGALVASLTGMDGCGGASVEGVEAPGTSGTLVAAGATSDSEVLAVAALSLDVGAKRSFTPTLTASTTTPTATAVTMGRHRTESRSPAGRAAGCPAVRASCGVERVSTVSCVLATGLDAIPVRTGRSIVPLVDGRGALAASLCMAAVSGSPLGSGSRAVVRIGWVCTFCTLATRSG